MTAKKVAVIGAGPGGLAAAMLLAHQGFDVTVFEKEEQVGGRSAALQVGDYIFDTGPTFLMMTYILEQVFKTVGRNIRDYLELILLDPMYRLQYEDKDVCVHFDKDEMAREIAEKFAEGSAGFERFYKNEQKRFNRLIPCLSRDYSSPTDLLKPDLFRALPYLGIKSSLFDVLGTYFKEDKLKLAFTFQAKYLGMSPWDCPGGFTIIPYIEHHFGIYHVKGGLNQICHAMVKVMEEEGGTLRLATPVASLLTTGRCVKGVRLADGSEEQYDYVVMNADFAYAMTNLVEGQKLLKYKPEKLAKMDYSCSTYMLYLGLDTIYDMPHHNIIFASNYRENVDSIFNGRPLTDNFSLYIHNPSAIDPTLAPPGHSALYVLVPVANNRSGIDWDHDKAAFREAVLTLIEQKTPMKDIRSRIQAEKIITPKEWDKDYHVYLGATFNLAHSIKQMLYFRPHNRFEELDGLYLVGGGTHPGSGLPTIYQSALISSALLTADSKNKARQGAAHASTS